MSDNADRMSVALGADSLRAWLRKQVGIVIGADEALREFDRRFAAQWAAQETLLRMAELGAAALTTQEMLIDSQIPRQS